MKRVYSIALLLMVCVLTSMVSAQTDHRQVVNVMLKASDDSRRWAPAVYNTVVEMLVKSQRFIVIDGMNTDTRDAEMARQSSEQFMYVDQNKLSSTDKLLAANKVLTVKVEKVPVYSFKTNGNVSGYKCAVAFQLILTDTESGQSTESESFQGKTSKEMLSAQAAVTEATKQTGPMVAYYLEKNFPLECSIEKILETKGDGAKTILLDVGKAQGVKVGDSFRIEYLEKIKGKILPTELGIAKIKMLKGDDFAEAEVVGKNAGKEIVARFGGNETLRCTQILK